MKPIDHSFHDHADGDVSCPYDAKHTEALRRRRAGAPAWQKIELRAEHGDWRHYLDGEPIRCGSGLELQSIKYEGDDYGEFTIRTDAPVSVRYEVEWVRERSPEGPPWVPVLYVGMGGHTFKGPLEKWMRFRWPVRR